ncbi:MAG: nascent polypeptide-associated complex protein [Candidatus Micrarchaeota archaeon]
MRMDPRQMAALARQMGIVSNEVKSKRVTIEKSDGGKIVIENPTVMAMDLGGQKNYTVSGQEREENAGTGAGSEEKTEKGEIPSQEESEEEQIEGISEKDIAMVAEQAKVTKEVAKAALEEANGDIAEAIMKLQK